jgi:small subunit ribosomal protein S20
MANHQSTKKRMRQNVKRREHNRSNRSRLRTQITKLRNALAAGDKTQSQTELMPTIALIDKMVNKKILHQNTAARYKSRLTKHVNELA